jgi:hypothetical protein
MSVEIVFRDVKVVIPMLTESPSTPLPKLQDHVDHPEIENMHQDKKKKDDKEGNTHGW